MGRPSDGGVPERHRGPGGGAGAGAGLAPALVSTLAGHLLTVGPIANIIDAEAARRQRVVIEWLRHARTGVPVTLATLATLAVTAAWLAWRP